MKKKYISPTTEQVTMQLGATLLHVSNIYNGDDEGSQYGGEYDKDPSDFEVGAKKFIWDDEDSPWNDYMN